MNNSTLQPQERPGFPSGSLEPQFIRAAREQRERILSKIESGAIFDPATVATLLEHLAELGKLLEDYEPEPEPEPEPVKKPVLVTPYYARRPKPATCPRVIGKAIPARNWKWPESVLVKKAEQQS